MANVDFTIGKGDLLPEIVITPLRADKSIVDISPTSGAASPKFFIEGIQQPATIFQDTDNVYKLKYSWVSGDTTTAGIYRCKFTVTFGSSLPETFPNNDYVLVQVYDGPTGQILTSRADYDSIISILGVTINDFSYDDIQSIAFLQAAEAKIMDTLAAQSGVPTVTQIMAGTSPATARDKVHLKAAVVYQLAYLFGPGETNSVDVSVSVGPITKDLGGLGETWIHQMEEFQIQCDYHISHITGFKKWRVLA